MTPRQFQNFRKRIGWPQTKLAEALDVHAMTISKWERGEQPIPRMAELAMCWLELTRDDAATATAR